MADKWFIEKNGKFYGPFEAAKVLAYRKANKINDATPVSEHRDGLDAKPFKDMQAILKSAKPAQTSPEPPPKKVQPPPRPQKPEPRAQPIPKEKIRANAKTRRIQRRNFLLIMAVIGIGVVGGAYYAVLQLQDSAAFEKVRMTILEESAPLRAQAYQTEVPNFNKMVLPAVKLLFLSYEQVVRSHQRSLVVYNSETGAKNFGHLYDGIVRREVQFLADGQLTYTYVFDETSSVVAVAVHGPTFGRLRREQVDFAALSNKPVREMARGEQIIWLSQLSADIQVQAHWKVDGPYHVLDYVAILPISGASE